MSSYERAKRWRDAKEQQEIAAARALIEEGLPDPKDEAIEEFKRAWDAAWAGHTGDRMRHTRETIARQALDNATRAVHAKPVIE